MRALKARVVGLVRWMAHRVPEGLLLVFAVFLAPLVYFLAGEVARQWSALMASPRGFVGALREEPWPALAWAACLLAAAGGAVLVLRHWAALWAVARKMILEALHRKVVVALLVFFVVLTPSLPFILKTEGNPKSQVQIVVSYSLALAEVLLAVLAVFVCTASVCSEIERKQVHITDTKPLARWQFLVGKLLGIVVMCAALLFLMGGAVYGLVHWLGRERSFAHLPAWEAQKRQQMLHRLHNEVLVARCARRPVLPDVSAAVEREYRRRMKLSGRAGAETDVPSLAAEGKASLREMFLWRWMTVPPMAQKLFVVRGLVRSPGQPLYLRFKPHASGVKGAASLRGVWSFHRAERGEEQEQEQEQEGSVLRLRTVYRRPGVWQAGAFQEISVDSAIVEPGGVVYLSYTNLEPELGVQFDPKGGVEVLQRVGGFFPNYYRAMLIIMCHVALLAALALMAGSALSFPVASFLVVALLVAGLLGPWVQGIHVGYVPPEGYIPELTLGQEVAKWALELFGLFVKGVLAVLPQLTRYSPVGDLVNGRLVGWGTVGLAAADLCLLRGGAALLLGVYLYTRRELARVIV